MYIYGCINPDVLMFRRLVTAIIFWSCTLILQSQDPASPDKTFSLLFIGDIMGHDEQIWSAENRETGEYDYDTVFSYIKPEISEAGIAIANFEVTLAGPPYKGYPQFSSPDELAVSCRNAGIDFFALANNHCADRGKKGIIRTISKLDSLGIPHSGTFKNSSSRDSLCPAIIEKEGVTIALLNYTYGTNGIVVQKPAVVNFLDKDLVTRDIKKAENAGADVIILFLHWGTEYDTIPSPGQTELAGYFFSQGADFIIGSHPHVIQKMLWMRNFDAQDEKILVYSLGNFVSNQRKPKTDGGAMVRIDLRKAGDTLAVTNTGYYLTWVYTPIVNYRKQYYILPCSKYENMPGFFSKPEEYRQMKRFISDSRELLDQQNVNFKEFIYSGEKWIQKR
jgi:poly-gamma-glutamate synthesis protein (capsule biosynthesis protein)